MVVPHLSLIVPTRAAGDELVDRVTRIIAGLPDMEAIIVQPDDRDDPEQPPIAHERVRLIAGPRGRGTQCNAGAAVAAGELLMFLHDDTSLPAEAFERIRAWHRDVQEEIACFRLTFDHNHWLLRTYSLFTRFDSLLTTFADQGIIIPRRLFERIGGMSPWPLFEDVEFFQRARRAGIRIVKLDARVTTSARRFIENGILRQQVLNTYLILLYLLGTPPDRLARRYDRTR